MATIDATNKESTLSELERRKNAFKSSTDNKNSTPLLRFPADIDMHPTYMEYHIFKFSTKSTSGSAFGNVGAVEVPLLKIYLSSIKSEITEGQKWEEIQANNAANQAALGLANDGPLAALGNTIKSGIATVGQKTAQTLKGDNTVGTAIVEKMSLKYDGPEQRSFTTTHTMVPRSPEEMNEIHNIIKMFRMHSAPSLDGQASGLTSGSRSYVFPSLFKIKWVEGGTGSDGNDNAWLPVHEVCYCNSVVASYGDDRMTSFYESGGAPTTYTITLSFKELDYPTRQSIEKGG